MDVVFVARIMRPRIFIQIATRHGAVVQTADRRPQGNVGPAVEKS